MSVTPAEYRNGGHLVTSTPALSSQLMGKDVDIDRKMFNLTRVKKVELAELSAKVSDFSGE